jgi:putative SOS response-associated peptidase YedK
MCGRYTLTASNKPDLAHLNLDIPDRYNIAPQADVLVETDQAEFTVMSWSFSPAWAKTPMNLFNARAETLTEKPSFKDAQRCVFIADGWYEWQRAASPSRPWYHHADGELLRFAGVYEPTSGCAIVTMGAQAGIADIHHRQPLLLSADASDQWLNGAPAGDCMTDITVDFHRVSYAVNNAKVDDPRLAHPLDESISEPEQGALFS